MKDTRPKQLYNRRSQNEIKDGGRREQEEPTEEEVTIG